jgi:hypothetical protein
MEQEPIPLIELVEFMLFLGSATFMLGAVFQAFILYRNKRTFITSISIIIITRLLTATISLFIWAYWMFDIDTMFLFIFLPALLPEVIFSLLALWLTGNSLGPKK